MKERKKERKMTPFERQKERKIDGPLRACLFKARVGIAGARTWYSDVNLRGRVCVWRAGWANVGV